jgi:hypothetical protein
METSVGRIHASAWTALVARGDANDVGRPHRAEMPQSLNDRAGGAARSDQVLGRGVTQVNDPLAKHDTAGRAIGQVDAHGRNLGGQAESVRCAGTGDLHLGLPGERPRKVIGGGRERAKLHLGEVVKAARQAAQLTALGQAR